MGMSGQRRSSASLYPRGKDPRYPLERRLGGPQSRYGHRGWRNNPLPVPGCIDKCQYQIKEQN
jgi:hypothetical protein